MKKRAAAAKPKAVPPAKKSEETRSLILETALELFTERGYEETTMRAIAEEAGVALGNAYYYFRSKEHLIQSFYYRLHEQHRETCLPIIQREDTLKGRLLAVMRQILVNMEPYHQFAGALFRTAADPHSPLNPFSAESEAVRKESTEWFAEVLRGTKTKIPADLAGELPTLLWLYNMGIVLFWIHDRSAKQIKTWRLMEQTVDIVTRLISLASLPPMYPLRKSTLRLLAALRDDDFSGQTEP
ncbi:MAG: TetR family transcriptional regulator [Blastocatellia bacterium]|nr:TetR family transcriptional regulator [Blastocatellia bacterium]